MNSPKEFWINFSGKKFNLNEINGGDGKGALDREENLKLLFDFFDVDSSGELEEKEVVALINKINQYAKKDGNSIFSAKEEEDFLYETREYADKSGGKIVKSLKDIGITRDQLVKFIEPIYKNFGKFNGIPHYELEAINFLSTAVNNGEQDLEAYNETRGVISKSVNLWRSVFNQENTRSEVEYSIKTTQEHVKSLTNAAKKSEKEFNKTYRNLRGVSFDSQAIEECTTKSKVYTSAKTTYDMVNYIKGDMLYHNQLMNGHAVIPVQAASSIMNALEMCGIKDINQINILLHNISEKNKNNPEFSRYGGNLRLSKTKNGNWEIYRDTPTGYPDTATPEQLNFVVHEILEMLEKQLALAFYAAPDSDNKDVLLQKAKNVFTTQEVMDLDKAYGQLAFNATTRGLTAEEFQLYTEIAKYKGMNDGEYSELVNKLLDNMNPSEIEKLNANILNYYKTEYEEAYAAAYGGEDPSKMAQIYIEKEQQGVQYIQMGLNIASMALMFIPGGAIASAPGWLAKGIKTAKAVTPFLMVTHPLDFLEKWTSNGISEQEFNEWFMSCAESAVFMAVGMGVGKVAECFSSVYKTKALVTFLKNSGKSVDEITSIIKANPLKFPQEVVEGLEHIDKVAKTLQISTEVAMDLSSTYALTKQMHGEGLTTFDWIQSVASAVAGSTLQKQFAPMSKEAKIDFLVKAFEDFNLSRDDAARILVEMDKVSAGEYNTHKTKSKTEFGSGSKVQEGAVLNEVVVKSDDATSAKSAGMKNVTDEFDMYLQGLKEHGNDFVPEFSDGTDLLLKEFCEYRAKNAKELSDRGIKVNYDKSRLGILSDFLMYIYSENKNISKESLSRIHDEIAKLMPEYMKTKFPNVRPEIAENADKIYKWKIAMSGQTSALKPDVNGVYAVINSKSFDAEAHNKAVKEFTEFLENMTGKKVLVGDSARFNEFVNMIGAFNNPDLYKDVDYIVLGHGVGSSLETDSSNSRVWRFKHSGEPVWQYIADNVPKGKKALLFVCDTALNPANRKNMPEMYDEKGVFMDAIGVPASGIDKSPAKIVISGINHVVGSVSAKSNGKPKYLINGAIGGEVTVTAYSLKVTDKVKSVETKPEMGKTDKIGETSTKPDDVKNSTKYVNAGDNAIGGVNNSISNFIDGLGLKKVGNEYVFNIREKTENLIKANYSEYNAKRFLDNLSKPLTDRDISILEMLVSQASTIMDVSSIQPDRLLMVYRNIITSDPAIFDKFIDDLSPQKSALILSIADRELISESEIQALNAYLNNYFIREINGALSNAKDKGVQPSGLVKGFIDDLSSLIQRQEIPESITVYRSEGFLYVNNSDNNYGCLRNCQLSNEYNGKTMAQVMSEISAMSDPAMRQEAYLKLRQHLLCNSCLATNERFMSCSLFPTRQATTGDVAWEITLPKGTHATYIQGNIPTNEYGTECELLLQRDSNVAITDIVFDNTRNLWTIKATVTN